MPKKNRTTENDPGLHVKLPTAICPELKFVSHLERTEILLVETLAGCGLLAEFSFAARSRPI
jgi:hypothetical protein